MPSNYKRRPHAQYISGSPPALRELSGSPTNLLRPACERPGRRRSVYSGGLNQMEELIRNFNDEREFNYSIHISDEFKFIYFNNPKCACTTIKATLNLSAATAAAKTIKYNGMQDIHDRNKNLLRNQSWSRVCWRYLFSIRSRGLTRALHQRRV